MVQLLALTLYPTGEYPVSAGLPAIAVPWFGSHNDYRFPLCCILTSKFHKVRLYDAALKRIVVVKPKVKPAEGQRTRSLIPGMLGHPALHPSVGMHIPFLINSSGLSDLTPRAEQALLGKLMTSTLNERLDLANPEVRAYVESVDGDLAPLYYRGRISCDACTSSGRAEGVTCLFTNFGRETTTPKGVGLALRCLWCAEDDVPCRFSFTLDDKAIDNVELFALLTAEERDPLDTAFEMDAAQLRKWVWWDEGGEHTPPSRASDASATVKRDAEEETLRPRRRRRGE
ncbi:uncharacterized protein LOC62_02G001794 [Vanrija pseudolonga]|uniref:Uncharacterized protein n=1 Tax=Vanrija pseudolonga TaxID=143232 RepID=A0AAF0Y4S3_9TREE|nr:hypothetical protein LOC62_02G001794 [Vanrija pseudolonga]